MVVNYLALFAVLLIIFDRGHAAIGTIKNKFVAKSLGSNMVLQRDVSSAVYGFSREPSNIITVSFDNQLLTTTSSATPAKFGGYFWKVDLPPYPGGLRKYSMKISSDANEMAILDNIVFGDVFLCSGQSNMQLSLAADLNATAEISNADNYPFIRLFSVGTDYSMPSTRTPLDDLYSVNRKWLEASSVNVNGGDWGYFSAVCYLTGKQLFLNSLKSQIPVGLVSSNWGGTYIEAWSPVSVKKTCNGTLGYDYAPKEPGANVNMNQDAILYNNMIAPFKNMKFNGVFWYQGESNAVEPSQYMCMKHEMVAAWRNIFQSDFPFMYVQLSTWDGGGSSVIANFRNAQYDILKTANKMTLITAADLGDPDSEFGDIHPRKKSEVGRRLALAASSLVYGVDRPHLGPLIEKIEEFEHSEYGWSLRLQFSTASCGTGIILQPPQECPDPKICAGPYLVYGDSKKIAANIAVSGSTSVEITPFENQGKNSHPSKFSYGQADYPMMTIYNSYGVPLLPYVWNI